MAKLCEIKSERSVIIEMLQAYKDFPCLWDVSDKFYKNTFSRQQAFEVLLEIWRKADSEATIESVKKKLENMRAAFTREWRKVENSKLPDSGSEQIHRPLLWYYDYFTFLKGSKTSKSVLFRSLSNSDDEGVNSLPESENEKRTSRNKRRIIESHNKEEKVQEIVHTSLPDEDKTSDSFARTIGLQLKEMTRFQRCIAEKLISEVMFYGKLDKLTMKSTIININDNTKMYNSALSLSPSHLNCSSSSSSSASNASSFSNYSLLPPLSQSVSSAQELAKPSKPITDLLENYDTIVKSESEYNSNFACATDSSELLPLQRSVTDHDITSLEFPEQANCEDEGLLLKRFLIIKMNQTSNKQ